SALLLNLVGVRKVNFSIPSDKDLEDLTHFLEKYEGNSMTHLLFLKDKSFFYTMDNQVLIAFRPYKDNLMVLGDPIGDPNLFKEAINEFRIYADKFDMTPIFYEVSEKHLPLYHENGFNFLKLGEEATMSFNDFSFAGKKSASLRTIRNKILRNEFEFEIIKPPFSPEFLVSLKEISDSWLGDRHEKVFSLGSFNADYINRSPLALVKKDGQILSFATIMPMYQEHIFSIDLMRLVPDSPNGTMEATFIGIIDWAKEEGYTHFVLGKAPLSNVGLNQFSSKREKIVKHFYNYGNRLYSFKGLRYFKEKFSPTWEGTYLAYPKNAKLSLVILNLARMISGKNENKK
ncbi:MAG: phosphatidylglycerol lysyltransferase domain-containing protein, partial [Cellulosilyticaceae bacterium]